VRWTTIVIALLTLSLGCDETSGERVLTERVAANEARGQEKMAELECVRCHSRARSKTTTNCVVCHNAIARGAENGDYRHAPPASSEQVRHWNSNIVHFREIPSFVGVTRLYRREWLEAYLVEPHDLRPRLGETMPNLGIDKQDARNIVAYLGSLDAVAAPTKKFFADVAIADWRVDRPPLTAGDITRGRAIYATRGCVSCHVFSGAVEAKSEVVDDEREARALELAPDLRATRARFEPLRIVPWLLAPRFFKHDAAMPDHDLSYQEARDLAAFVMTTPLDEPLARKRPRSLGLLDRRVDYDEVFHQVFGKICVHCHANPDSELGDGGPGFAGGFGFTARKLDLSDYESTFAGFVDDDGQRRSVFAPAEPGGVPRLVAALWARWDEEVTGEIGDVRGMPLALPPLSAKQIQLVETWIAQGRRR
jgi:cytochrome c2